ncbi:MAG: adenylate/guanylate cyclase domain-containing protein [Pseudomonadales bacterium]
MHNQAESEFLQSTRAVSAHIAELSNQLSSIELSNTADFFLDELTELLRALERLKECLDYRPLASSADGERTWTHDFRNHLNSVKGYAELSLEEEQAEQFELSGLLLSILDQVSRLNNQSVPTPVGENVTGQLRAARISAERTGTVLVVEDNEDNRMLLVRVLRAQGHVAIEASSAVEAFQRLQEHEVELILLDLILPDMNGYDILQQLKNDPSLRSISVIMVSGQHEHDEAIRCIQAGAEDYLFKPVNQVLLTARIDANLERKSWRDREQNYLNELARSHAFIRKTFGRYTSEEIVDRLLEDPHGLELGGRLQNVSILMTDICSFTTLCDTLAPQEVVQLLNNYLGTLSEVILAHNGTIDEFIGDAILAIFGAPFSLEDDADRAVKCAIAMQQAMRDVNSKNQRDGLPSIETAIAINSGRVIAGNIGSERRSKFAVVGQPVNLTARIEEVTGAGEVFISENTRRELSQTLNIIESRTLRAKGFKSPITIHKVCCNTAIEPVTTSTQKSALQRFENSLDNTAETQHA